MLLFITCAVVWHRSAVAANFSAAA